MGGATWAALRVSAARLRARPLRPILVVSGVALAFAMVVSVVGGSLVARQQALRQGLDQLPEDQRGFRVDRFGLPLAPTDYRRQDHNVRRVLGTLATGQVRRVVFFRQLRVQGQLVEIAAVDRLPEILTRLKGRLPRTCTAAGCEVLVIGGGRPASPRGTSGSNVVGSAQLRDPNIFGYVAAATEGKAAPPLVMLAPSIESLQSWEALKPYYRVYSWLVTTTGRGSAHVADRADPRAGIARPGRSRLRRLRFSPEQPGRGAAERRPPRAGRCAAPDARRRRDERAAARVRDDRGDRPSARARRRAPALARERSAALAGLADARRRGRRDDARRELPSGSPPARRSSPRSPARPDSRPAGSWRTRCSRRGRSAR